MSVKEIAFSFWIVIVIIIDIMLLSSAIVETEEQGVNRKVFILCAPLIIQFILLTLFIFW